MIEDYIFIFTLMLALLSLGYIYGRKNLLELQLQQITQQEVLSDLNVIECTELMKLLNKEIEKGNNRETLETYIKIYNKLNKIDVKKWSKKRRIRGFRKNS